MDSDRAFLFLVHRNHGLLLLYTTRKKSKAQHYQVPGGHVDQEDIDTAGVFVIDNRSD
jgi:8-oxo-dGTP pyrophosphatase MutT (NUDIX family)